MIALAIDLHKEGLKPADVAKAEILMGKVNFQTVGQSYDVTRKSVVHAQFNARYTFARALTDGRIDLHSYTLPVVTDPAVAELAARVSVSIDPQEAATDMAHRDWLALNERRKSDPRCARNTSLRCVSWRNPRSTAIWPK